MTDRMRRKADQHWEMAGCARQDGDAADAARHTALARAYERGEDPCPPRPAKTPSYMSAREIETAREVVAQHDLTVAEQKQALREINQVALVAPFNAYSAAHRVCAAITQARSTK